MKSFGDQTVNLMSLLFGFKSVHADLSSINHDAGSEFSFGSRNALRNIFIPLVVFVLAVLTWRADAKVFPSVISRVAVLVVDKFSIRDLNPLHCENDSVQGGIELHALVCKLNPFGCDACSGTIVVENYGGFGSSGTCVKTSPCVLFFEVVSRSLFPDQLSGFLVVREALLQEILRWQNNSGFHNRSVVMESRRIWEPNTPRCAASFLTGLTNIQV